jgi:hypothetical protein
MFVALLIQHYGGRQRAFNIALCGWLICGTLVTSMYFFVERDEDRVQEALVAARSIPHTHDDPVCADSKTNDGTTATTTTVSLLETA